MQNLRHPGIEPGPPAWKADVLTTTPVPCHQTRGLSAVHQSMLECKTYEFYSVQTIVSALISDGVLEILSKIKM